MISQKYHIPHFFLYITLLDLSQFLSCGFSILKVILSSTAKQIFPIIKTKPFKVKKYKKEWWIFRPSGQR